MEKVTVNSEMERFYAHLKRRQENITVEEQWRTLGSYYWDRRVAAFKFDKSPQHIERERKRNLTEPSK